MSAHENGTYIYFEREQFQDEHRPRWTIRNKRSNDMLGIIHWYGTWRRYITMPFEDIVFDALCLREIADFLERKTKEHKR